MTQPPEGAVQVQQVPWTAQLQIGTGPMGQVVIFSLATPNAHVMVLATVDEFTRFAEQAATVARQARTGLIVPTLGIDHTNNGKGQ